MRISDWSSDVCSSDLFARQVERPLLAHRLYRPFAEASFGERADPIDDRLMIVHRDRLRRAVIAGEVERGGAPRNGDDAGPALRCQPGDRKGVWRGRSVAVHVELRGRPLLQKKTNN